MNDDDLEHGESLGNDRPAGRQTTWPYVVVAALSVLALSVAFRLPSCGESFWLDELHSAWAVGGAFGEVADRAAVGNQTPGYFHLLWIWSSAFGSGEVAMRLSSVIASSLASALLVVAVTRRIAGQGGGPSDRLGTGRLGAGRLGLGLIAALSGGLVAGAILAMDTNAIFFGCELRPYAFVMLYAVLAVWSMMAWIDPPAQTAQATGNGELSTGAGERRSSAQRDGWWRFAMLFWICVAALVHPTSLGVLAWLVPVAFVVAWRSDRMRWSRFDVLSGIIVLATVSALATSSLPDSWERRDLWRAFGQATSWRQLWSAWAWWPIVLLPAILALVLGGISWLIRAVGFDVSDGVKDGTAIRRVGFGLIPGLVATAGTCLFFVASYWDWVPLWHRRYFVAALPLLAWTAGELAAHCTRLLQRLVGATLRRAIGRDAFSISDENANPKQAVRQSSIRVTTACGAVIATALLGFLLWYEGTLKTLARFEPPYQLRGEVWREASQWVGDRVEPGDSVWLDSQLIEADFFRFPFQEAPSLNKLQWNYLGFPLAGPYAIKYREGELIEAASLAPVVPMSCAEHESWIERQVFLMPEEPTTVFLVSRSGKNQSDRFIERISRFRDVKEVDRFSGRPHVIRLIFSP